MFLSPILGFLVQSFDIRLELSPIDSPNAPPSDLHGRQLARSNQGVDLRHADTEISGDVFQSEEARFNPGRGLRRSPTSLRSLLGRHGGTIAPVTVQGVDLFPFAAVCGQVRATARRGGWM